MKHLLITGATGFIASHLLPILSARNYQIKAATRRDVNSSSLYNTEVIKVGEIDGATDWHEALRGVDTIIHLAARAHILDDTSEDVESEFLRVNTQGTINLVQQAIKAGVKHFIFISSIGAMATLSREQLTLKSPCKPDTPYGRSKYQAELALIELSKNTQMEWTIIRPTLVYGPGNPGNMARLIKLVKLGLPLPFSSINNRRSFLYVGNLVEAIAKIIEDPDLAAQQIFLLSDGEDLSTPELIRRLSQNLQQPCQLLPIPPSLLRGGARIATILESWTRKSLGINQTTMERLLGSLYVDNQHIQDTLKWHLPYTFDQGLQNTLKR